MVCRVSLVLKTPGYRSPGEKGAPTISTAENSEIRVHQWRKVVLVGSRVKNSKDMGPLIQKGASAPVLWETQGYGH
ncbi:hypothetical protein Y032_0026g1469 [Ancylostoma ceylanicum]|uniref:Uncharacterized protein n=1 Tax=Ancylostoma ceylanicum TaxID=53326 RepID=A0A016UUS9_9BILA|nr:hypothetical protein Y032_0026g1469 [Ancylostoma ceylanicum]